MVLGQVVPFDVLEALTCDVAAPTEGQSRSVLVGGLAVRHGVLVRGSWVVKSAEIFARGGGGAEAQALAAHGTPSLNASLASLQVRAPVAGGSPPTPRLFDRRRARVPQAAAAAGQTKTGAKTGAPSLTPAEQILCDARDTMLVSLRPLEPEKHRGP